MVCIYKTGLRRPFSEKVFKSIGYPIPVKFKSGKQTDIYIRLKHINRPLRSQVYLMNLGRMIQVLVLNDSFIWFWRGVFLFALTMSLILFLFVHLRVFIYYFFLNIGIGLFFAAQVGDYFMFFDLDETYRNQVIDFTGVLLISIFFPLFLGSLAPVKKRNPVLWKIVFILIIPMIFLTALNYVPSLRNTKLTLISHFYFMFGTMIIFLLQPIMLVKCLINKDKNSLVLFFVYGFYVVSAFVDAILPDLGYVKESPFAQRNLMAGSFIEIISFMFLMGKVALNVYKDHATLLEKEQHHQKEILLSMVEGQEKERDRLGKDLHDLVGGNMAIIKQRISKSDTDLSNIVSKTIESVRDLSHSLVTPKVEKGDFKDEIKEICHLFSNEEIEAEVYFHNWPNNLNPTITTHFYRIIQEFLQNALKHSRANNVYLQLIGEDPHSLRLVYEDDGRGFDSEKVKAHNKGIGLNNILNRVTLLNGTLEIDSNSKGGGTTIIIEIQNYFSIL